MAAASLDEGTQIDWRHRVAATLEEDLVHPVTGVRAPKGTPITADTFIKHGNREIRIGDPSAPALFLNSAHRAYQQAMGKHPFGVDTQSLDHSGSLTSDVYDYLEQIMASTVFSFAAIEAFVNEEIPKDYIDEVDETLVSGIVVVHHRDHDEIVRFTGLSEKLSRILPEIKKVPSPKGSRVWEEFVHLRKLRDRIVHLKSSDRHRSNTDNVYPDSIWRDLLDPQQKDFPLAAKEMMLHFKRNEHAHWLENCPF